MAEGYLDFDKKPFELKHLEGKAPRDRDVVPVSFNEEERKLLEEVKASLNCPFDSTVLKLALRQLRKVIQGQLDSEVLGYLVSARRRRNTP